MTYWPFFLELFNCKQKIWPFLLCLRTIRDNCRLGFGIILMAALKVCLRWLWCCCPPPFIHLICCRTKNAAMMAQMFVHQFHAQFNHYVGHYNTRSAKGIHWVAPKRKSCVDARWHGFSPFRDFLKTILCRRRGLYSLSSSRISPHSAACTFFCHFPIDSNKSLLITRDASSTPKTLDLVA